MIAWAGPSACAIEQPIGSAQPTPDGCHQAGVDQQEQRHHGRGTGRSTRVTPLDQQSVQVLPCRHRRLEVADAVLGFGPQLEPVGEIEIEVAGALVELVELVERSLPVTAVQGRSRTFDLLGNLHVLSPVRRPHPPCPNARVTS